MVAGRGRAVGYRRRAAPSLTRTAYNAAMSLLRNAGSSGSSVRSWSNRIRQRDSVRDFKPRAFKRYKTKSKPVNKFFTVGKMGPKFRRSKAKKPSKMLKNGVTRYIENGGIVGSADCAYVGHSFAPAQLFAIMVDSIVRDLFIKAGHRVVSMNHSPETTASFRWSYRTTVGGSPVVRVVNIATTDTFRDIAANFRTDVLSVASTTVDDWTMYEIRLRNTTLGTDYMASLYFDDVMLQFDCSSSIAIQNRTLADSTATDTGNRNEVTNNPIGGKSYEGYGNGASLKLWDNALAIASSVLMGQRNTGVIRFDPNEPNVTPEQGRIYKRPNHMSAYSHVTKSASARLNPGQIRNSTIAFKRVMYWNTMFKKLYPFIKEAGSVDQYLPIGSFRFFAFEKKCNTQTVAEQNISLGFEMNSVYRCRMWKKLSITAPDIEVL